MRDRTIWRVGKFKPFELDAQVFSNDFHGCFDVGIGCVAHSVQLFASRSDIHGILYTFSDVFESKAGDAGSGNRNCYIRIRAPLNEFPLDQLL